LICDVQREKRGSTFNVERPVAPNLNLHSCDQNLNNRKESRMVSPKSAVRSFEDLVAWQVARELVREIYRETSSGNFARDFGLRDQIRRASVSVISNIAEGFERGGNKEFIQFLYHAKGSCGEVRTQLYVAWDLDYLTEDAFQGFHFHVER
jgi:four helix bundle protein